MFDEFGFDQHTERIYNMDETGVPLEPRPPKVVAFKGQKKVRITATVTVRYRTSGQKAQITVTRDLKITHPVRLRRFRLKFNGIGRRGFNQQKRSPRLDLDW